MQDQLLHDFGSIGYLAKQNGPEEHWLCHTAHTAIKFMLENLVRNPSPPQLSLASWNAMGKLKPFGIAENEEPLAGRYKGQVAFLSTTTDDHHQELSGSAADFEIEAQLREDLISLSQFRRQPNLSQERFAEKSGSKLAFSVPQDAVPFDLKPI